MEPKKILIVGAGFAGISCALNLSNRHLEGVKITLVDPYPHFEYHAMLYRVLTGRSALEVCIPLREIFRQRRNVEVVEDMIMDIDFKKSRALGKSGFSYHYDNLVLGLGSEPSYFDIEGLKEYSFSFDSIESVIRLKNHIHKLFSDFRHGDSKNNMSGLHIVIVGGGASGLEIAGSLALYTKQIAKKHGIEEAFLTIDLISSSVRLVPQFPDEISDLVRYRLGSLGVNVYLGRRVMKEEIEEVYIKDMILRAKTVIWCAGTEGNHLYRKFGLPVNEKGRVKVNQYLQTAEKVYIIGDGADTKLSGFSQTAILQGNHAAGNIVRSLHGEALSEYIPEIEDYFLPVGNDWAATEFLGKKIHGKTGWYLKRIHDLRFFMSILPLSKAIAAWKEDSVLWETCKVCTFETASRIFL